MTIEQEQNDEALARMQSEHAEWLASEPDQKEYCEYLDTVLRVCKLINDNEPIGF